jgi:hypothetical protein
MGYVVSALLKFYAVVYSCGHCLRLVVNVN